MEGIPVFDEFGFSPTSTFKIPTWVWILLAFILGGVVALICTSEEEKVIRVQEPESNKKIA